MRAVGRAFSLALAAALLSLFAVPAAAGQPEPTPTGELEQPCAVGELCLEEGTVPGGIQRRGPVNDPPGNVARSLATIGFIGCVVGLYLYVALTGRSLPFTGRRQAGRA